MSIIYARCGSVCWLSLRFIVGFNVIVLSLWWASWNLGQVVLWGAGAVTNWPSGSTMGGLLLSSLTCIETKMVFDGFRIWGISWHRRDSGPALLWVRPVRWVTEKLNSCQSIIHCAKRPLASIVCSQHKALWSVVSLKWWPKWYMWKWAVPKTTANAAFLVVEYFCLQRSFLQEPYTPTVCCLWSDLSYIQVDLQIINKKYFVIKRAAAHYTVWEFWS